MTSKPLQITPTTAISWEDIKINIYIDGEEVGFVYDDIDARDMMKDIAQTLLKEITNDYSETKIENEDSKIKLLSRSLGVLYNGRWVVKHTVTCKPTHRLVRHAKDSPVPPPLPRSINFLVEIQKVKNIKTKKE